MNTILYNADNILQIGTKVYHPIPATQGVREGVVGGYTAVVQPNEVGQLTSYVTGYRLGSVNWYRENQFVDDWKGNEFCLTEEEAQSLAKWYPVVATPAVG
jgi:hypothetical protein